MGFGTHNQPPGTWSDDTSMTLCLLQGLVEELSINEIAELFQDWLFYGHWTPHGNVFDCGITTRESIISYEYHDDRRNAGGRDEFSNGNGSLMRTLPIALMSTAMSHRTVAQFAHDISQLTHAHPRSQMACGIYCDFAQRLYCGEELDSAWESARSWAREFYTPAFPSEVPFFESVLSMSANDYRSKPVSEVSSSGYVIHTLDAALWCLFRAATFSDCCLTAVNLGGDTDTTGAVAGGLAGVYFGVESIPEQWVKSLARIDDIRMLIDKAFRRI